MPYRFIAEARKTSGSRPRASAFISDRRLPTSILSAKPWTAWLLWCVPCVAKGTIFAYVDAGGGLGISYEANPDVDLPAAAKQYAKALLEPLKGLGIHLLLEPGRAIVAPAGVLLTRVVYRKRNDGKQFVVVDAAMNDLLRPSLYGAYHEIVPVVHGRRPDDRES